MAAVALGCAACGGSDGGGGDTEAFCEELRVLDAADDEAGEDLTGAVDQFDALLADAPDEVAGDLRIVIEVFTELDSIDEDDPDAFEQFFELFERPEFVDATERLERFGVEECGLDPADDGSGDVTPGELELDEIDTGDIESELGEAETADDEVKTTTVPGDPYDEAFWGPIDPAELSIPGLEQHLDVNYPDSGWFDDTLVGSSIGGTEVIVYADVDAADAIRLCDAVLEYAGSIVSEVEVEVEQSNTEVALATGNVADGCAAA